MLIEYKTSNYRSIYDEQSFNMIAVNSYKEKYDTNVIKYSNQFDLLKSTAIYGPNASGKSTLLDSLDTLRYIVLNSSTKFGVDSSFPVKPFAFGETSKDEPTTFDITFIENNIKYTFGLVVTRERVLEEYLIAYPSSQPQTWYIRMYDQDDGNYKYKFGSFLKGQKKTWEKATKKNSLFLSTAINLQDHDDNQLMPVYNWFSKKLTPVSIVGWTNHLSKEYCTDEKRKKQIVNFLKLAGIDIEDINVEIKQRRGLAEEIEDEELKNTLSQMESWLMKTLPEKDFEEMRKEIDIYFVHTNGIILSLHEQSDGTQKLFSFASHWLKSLDEGRVLFIDELNDNLHPSLVKLLVDMFNDDKLNTKNAQLIFTTHETSILNQDVLRRDQVWFTDRDKNLSTRIYPLSDFKPRKDYENIENSYLFGRYGAIPYFNKVAYKMHLLGD